MNIEEQVLSIEQAKHLQELGLDMSDAAHFWCSMKLDTQGHKIKKREWYITLDKSQMHCGFMMFEYIPTYTLQEVLDKLPKNIAYDSKIYRLKYGFMHNIIYYREAGDNRSNAFAHCGDIMSNVYKALCWVLENGYLKEDAK